MYTFLLGCGHGALILYWPNAGPPSTTLVQLQAIIGSTSRVCWVVTVCYMYTYMLTIHGRCALEVFRLVIIITILYIGCIGNTLYDIGTLDIPVLINIDL